MIGQYSPLTKRFSPAWTSLTVYIPIGAHKQTDSAILHLFFCYQHFFFTHNTTKHSNYSTLIYLFATLHSVYIGCDSCRVASIVDSITDYNGFNAVFCHAVRVRCGHVALFLFARPVAPISVVPASRFLTVYTPIDAHYIQKTLPLSLCLPQMTQI